MRKTAFLAVWLTAATAAGAFPALADNIGSNYSFPDGSPGFSLVGVPAVQSGSPFVDPTVAVEFNPQPDPPGTPATVLSLVDPANPLLVGDSSATVFDAVFWFQGIGATSLGSENSVQPGPCRVTVQPGPCRSVTFTTTVGDVLHSFELDMSFSGGGDIANQVAFNPQPDPPANWFGTEFSFTGDPNLGFSLSEDGTTLDFSVVPEPASATLFGSAMIGVRLLRRRAAVSGRDRQADQA